MPKTIHREEYEAACIKIDEYLSGALTLALYEVRLLTDIIEHYQWQQRQRVIHNYKRKLAAKEATNE